MRATLTLLLALLSACSLEPVDIARVAPDDDEALGDPSWGEGTVTWLENDLCAGVVEQIELGELMMIYTSPSETATGATLRTIELEILALDPPQFAADLVIELRDRDGVLLDGFSGTRERMHFEATLELGWSIGLRAASGQRVELHAAFVESP